MRSPISYVLVVAGLIFPALALTGQSRAELKLAEAEILMEAGRVEEALQTLADALRSDPMSIDAERMADIAQVDAMLFDDSPESQEKVRELRGRAKDLLRMWLDRRGPEQPVLMTYLGQLRLLEQFDEGFAWLEKMLRKSPADAALRRELLVHSGAARDVERAVEQAQWFLKSESTSSELQLAGVILFELASKGEKDREALARMATEVFRTVLDRDPEYFDSAVYLSLNLKLQADLTSDRAEAERLRSQSELALERAKKIGEEKRWLARMRSWEIDIIQDGESKLDRWTTPPEAWLERGPFTIRVRIAEPVYLSMNVETSAGTIERFRDGFDFDECHQVHTFPCSGTGVAKSPGDTWLPLDANQTVAFEAKEEPGDWTRVFRDGEDWILERDVSQLAKSPLVFTTIPEIYLTLLIHVAPEVSSEDVRFVRVMFAEP